MQVHQDNIKQERDEASHFQAPESQIMYGSISPVAQAAAATPPGLKDDGEKHVAANKRRCISTACIACRKRKSKCDGNTPSCAACSSVYGTECIYDPNSDHRRKGVYKRDNDHMKTRTSTLQTLVHAIRTLPVVEVDQLVKLIRSSDNLDAVAETLLSKENKVGSGKEEADETSQQLVPSTVVIPQFEKELSGRIGELRLDNGAFSIIGGTSNLIWIGDIDGTDTAFEDEPCVISEEPVTSWTTVTEDSQLVSHLLNMYFTWHYTFFPTLSRTMFWKDFRLGYQSHRTAHRTEYCTPLLVNTMLALGCHFTSWPGARADPANSATAGDHFFQEAKRLILERDEHEHPRLATVQALALMSMREAGCGREASGWIYSGMSFRMANDIGLNIESSNAHLEDTEVDARRMTMWGCFLFDKCWSNYLGRQPQLPLGDIGVPKFDVFPTEDAETWRPYLDSGTSQNHAQPSRTRAAGLHMSALCEISGDLLSYFYHPHQNQQSTDRPTAIKKLGDLHTRLESWRKLLPKELESRDGQLPHVLVMHMFFHLLFIHLFRPFLKYPKGSSSVPAHVSPRKILTHAASSISKLLRLYKRMYGLRQICNIAVYITHTACTIHLLNLPDKAAQRDFQHGLNHLEEIGEGWLCARRTLGILSLVATRWRITLPDGAVGTLARVANKYGPCRISSPASPDLRQDRDSKSGIGSSATKQTLRQNQTARSVSANHSKMSIEHSSTAHSGEDYSKAGLAEHQVYAGYYAGHPQMSMGLTCEPTAMDNMPAPQLERQQHHVARDPAMSMPLSSSSSRSPSAYAGATVRSPPFQHPSRSQSHANRLAPQNLQQFPSLLPSEDEAMTQSPDLYSSPYHLQTQAYSSSTASPSSHYEQQQLHLSQNQSPPQSEGSQLWPGMVDLSSMPEEGLLQSVDPVVQTLNMGHSNPASFQQTNLTSYTDTVPLAAKMGLSSQGLGVGSGVAGQFGSMNDLKGQDWWVQDSQHFFANWNYNDGNGSNQTSHISNHVP